jgi:hypothetical protein
MKLSALAWPVLPLLLALGGCSSSSSTTTASSVTTEVSDATAATEPPASSVAAIDAASSTKALPTAAEVCGLVEPAALETIFGVAFVTGSPEEIAAGFPSCSWTTAAAIGGVNGRVQIRLCCPSMSKDQIAASLALPGGSAIGDQMIGLVRGPDDDIKMAQLKAYRNDVFVEAQVEGIGEPSELGTPIPGQKQLEALRTFTESIADRL